MKNVKKREVFYLAGYDPRGVRQYYNLYKQEALKSAPKMNIDVSSKKRTDKHMHTWVLTYNQTQTNYHFLEWDDLIRRRWKISLISIIQDLIFYMRVYWFTGLIRKFVRLSPNQLAAAIYPILYMTISLLLSLIIIYSLNTIMCLYFHSSLIIIISVFLLYLLMKSSVWIGNKIAVFWLLRIYVFSAEYVLSDMKELDKRLEYFSKTIKTIVENDDTIDELLIVGHSVGTIILIPMVEKLLATMSPDNIIKISILTLGNCIPLVSFLPQASKYHDSMRSIAQEKSIYWVDYTSAIDGACFPLLDYYKHSGITQHIPSKPLFLSPRFHTLYKNDRYNTLKKDKYLSHFLYLMSTDTLNDYNYFKLTAGEKILQDFIQRKDK